MAEAMDDGGPMFPHPAGAWPGGSVRDWLVGQVLTGATRIMYDAGGNYVKVVASLVQQAEDIADEYLRRRAERLEKEAADGEHASSG